MANILFKIDAVKFGVFKLTSGKASPYYIDLRVIPSFPDAFREICDFYAQYITSQIGLKNFDRIAGIPLAGIPFASQIAYNLKKPFLYVRKGIRLHGRERQSRRSSCFRRQSSAHRRLTHHRLNLQESR